MLESALRPRYVSKLRFLIVVLNLFPAVSFGMADVENYLLYLCRRKPLSESFAVFVQHLPAQLKTEKLAF